VLGYALVVATTSMLAGAIAPPATSTPGSSRCWDGERDRLFSPI
jgi:hypothetical protein